MAKRAKLIRWTCEQAQAEFGADSATIMGRIRQAGTLPGADGKYSTRQIALAVFGDMDCERLREKRHQANLLELEERRIKGEVFTASKVVAIWETHLVALRTAIWNFDAPEEKRRQWMDELKAVTVAEYQDSTPAVEADTE